MGYNTKIDWCDTTWNPVTGCEHGCPYCYARGIAERYGTNWLPDENPGTYKCVLDGTETHAIIELDGRQARMRKNGKIVSAPYPLGFTPTFHKYRLDEPVRWTQPRNIFVCSMADLFGYWVPDEWILEVFKACRAAPQHRFMFLTKNPDRYFSLHSNGELPNEKNFYYGITMDTKWAAQKGVRKIISNELGAAIGGNRFNHANLFVSVEPMLEDFGPTVSGLLAAHVPWIILGAETGRRKDIVKPEKEWAMRLSVPSKELGGAIFMKESLREIMGNDFRQEFPWEV